MDFFLLVFFSPVFSVLVFRGKTALRDNFTHENASKLLVWDNKKPFLAPLQASRRCSSTTTPVFSLWVWRMMIRASVVTAVPLALWVIHNLSNGVSRPDADRPGARGHAGLLECTLCGGRMCCRSPMYLLSVESLSKHECVRWGSCRCWWRFFQV